MTNLRFSRQLLPLSIAIIVGFAAVAVSSGESLAQPPPLKPAIALPKTVGGVQLERWYRVVPQSVDQPAPALAREVPRNAVLQPGVLQFKKESNDVIREVTLDGKLRWDLPFMVRTWDQAGNNVDVMPRVLLEGSGAMWDPKLREYVGQFSVGLVVRNAENVVKQLSPPVPLQLSGSPTRYSERSWEWGHTALPYKAINVGARAISGVQDNTLQLIVMAVSESNAVTLDVPLIGEPLQLSPKTQNVEGWGVDEVIFTVLGPPPAPGEPITVHFSAPGLKPPTLRVALDASGSGTAKFRSGESGNIPVSATYGPHRANAAVHVIPPYFFVGLALIGGLAGAIVSTKKISLRLIGPGLLGGVVAPCLYSLGLWVDVLPSGGSLRVGAFAVAVLGGWGGDKTLGWVWNRFMGGKPPVGQ